MSVFTIADLHLDVKTNKKSMEVFGSKWQNYTDRIKSNWKKLVTDNDTVIIPGDISWGLTTEAALSDLLWINELPGHKILLKGNHDFWWSTLSKMRRIFAENNIDTLTLLQNNAIEVEGFIIAGSRGWFVDRTVQSTQLDVNYDKLVNREVIRLRMSLEHAKALNIQNNREIIVFLHFPPIWNDFCCNEIVDLLLEHGIKKCYFGHIHGCYTQGGCFEYKGIEFFMVSADYLDFIPLFIG